MAKWTTCVVFAAIAFAQSARAESASTLLVEAEGFADLGGWVVDPQFTDQMGSPFLLAHGLGVPVKDASTTLETPTQGTYRVWVRTRNWTAPWQKPGEKIEGPGAFQLLIDGKPLGKIFGATEGSQWTWSDGGQVELHGKSVSLALRDLTGFDGRCDAIVLSSDPKFTPPNEAEAMAAFRRKALGLGDTPDDGGKFDLVVVGGGIAGTCAAISAARAGLQVALIQDRPVLGGNNSSEVRVHLQGKVHLPPYPALGNAVDLLDPRQTGNAQPPEKYNDGKKLAAVESEKNIRLLLGTRVFRVEKAGAKIAAVIGKNVVSGKETRLAAPLFADCTGDGTVGYLAGADFRQGRESRDETGESLAPETADQLTMGSSAQWYSVASDKPHPFPPCPWAIQFNEKTYQRAAEGEWDWETGFGLDQVRDFEQIRDHALRAVYGNWAYQKHLAPDKEKYAGRDLAWVAYVAGKRESRRLLGDVILCQQDLDEAKPYDDASFTTTWTIDLHYPKAAPAPGEAPFRSNAEHRQVKPYGVPYRCLYSRNIENLFMAGRNISVTHVALGTVRVQRTTGMMGEVVGMAAAICMKSQTLPRGVFEKHLPELKERMTRGVETKQEKQP